MRLRWRLAQFFEIRWWQRYLDKKNKSAYLAWKRRYWLDFIQKTGLNLLQKDKILDAGCGPAGIFIVLNQQTADAVDPLLEAYEKRLNHFRRSDYPWVRFFAEPLETFGSDSSYDWIFCLNALNHVADLPACLDKLAALTKPGGTLVLSIDVHRHAFLKHVFRTMEWDILHPHQHDLDEYRAMLIQDGFNVERDLLLKREMIFNYYVLIAKKPA